MFRRAMPHGLAIKSIAPRRFRLFPLGQFPKRHPVIFGSIVAAAKTGAADYFVQRHLEGKSHEQVDWRRVSLFTSFGAGYLGCIQYFIYVQLFTRVLFKNAASFLKKPLRKKLNDYRGWRDAMGQVACDCFVHGPFLYFPSFYVFKQYMEHESGSADWLQDGLKVWKKNIQDDMIEYWKVWIPGMAINFSLLPGYMRVPFIAGISAVWCVMLSAMRGSDSCDDSISEGALSVPDSFRQPITNDPAIVRITHSIVEKFF